MGHGLAAYRAGDVSERTAAVIDFVEVHGPVIAGDVAEELGMSKNDASTYLWRVWKYGYVERVGRGLYAAKGEA